MASAIVLVITNFIFSYLFLKILKVIKDLKVSVSRAIAFIVVASLVNTAVVLPFYEQRIVKILLSAMIYLLFVKVLFKEYSASESLFACCLYLLALMIGEVVGLSVISIIKLSGREFNGIFKFVALVCNSILIFYALINIIAFAQRHGKEMSFTNDINSWNKGLILIILILVTNISLITLYSSNTIRAEQVIYMAPLSVIIIIGYAIYIRFVAGVKEQNNRELQYYVETMESLATDIKQFKHDFQNVLISLYGLAENHEWDRLSERLLELQEMNIIQCATDIGSMANIKDVSLIKLVAAKMHIAKERNIKFYFEAPHIINTLPIEGVSFIRVIGGLLDNAIEAAEESEDREVGVIFMSYDSFFEMTVINSIGEEPIELATLHKQGYSSRGEGRGMGLSSVASILEKYQPIEWSTVVRNGYFIQCISFEHDN